MTLHHRPSSKTLECRHCDLEKARCKVLPDHLIPFILNKAGEDRWELCSLLELRLVCKAWKDAFAHFAGPASIDCPSVTSLEKVCTTMPGLCQLSVESNTAEPHLAALTSLSRLSKLRLSPGQRLCQTLWTTERASAFPSEEDLDALQHLLLLQVSHLHQIQ